MAVLGYTLKFFEKTLSKYVDDNGEWRRIHTKELLSLYNEGDSI